MKTASDNLKAALTGGSISRRLVADSFYGATRTLQDIPISTWSIRGDLTAAIKTGADVTILYTDDFARAATPHELTDALAPYGQELHLYMVIKLADTEERLPLGQFRIESVPGGTDAQRRFRDRVITEGSTVQVTLMDRFLGVQRARFRSLQEPASLTSAWAELARISGLAVTRTVPDVAIPSTLVYDRDRLQAVQLLAGVLGGTAIMTSQGTVAVIPNTPGDVVATLAIGEDGVVTDVQYSMQSENAYNVVTGDFETDDGTPIHVEAQISTGPLAIDSPYGEHVLEYPGDKSLITTQAAAQAAVDQLLEQSSVTEAYELPVQCVFNPLLELGDVVQVERMDRLITGRINTLDYGDTGPMSLRLGVISDNPL
ncbi:MAG: hypothetical protein KF861_00295 [Planctomycetaceae bacterium]|nr:hypothetical protein [Planctomycetaceae bacterium]